MTDLAHVASEFEPPSAKNEQNCRAIERNANDKRDIEDETWTSTKCWIQKRTKRGILVARVTDMRSREIIARRRAARQSSSVIKLTCKANH